jgi:hypothetical protein
VPGSLNADRRFQYPPKWHRAKAARVSNDMETPTSVPVRSGGAPTPLLVASCSWPQALSAAAARQWAKIRLAGILLGHIEATGCMDCHCAARCRQSKTPKFSLNADRLGRPLLSADGRWGPGVSYSHLGRETWAAAACGSASVGIDAADRREFSGPYPFRRVFHPGEFNCFTEALQSRQKAAAALWSAKEAVVKALGCAYHFFGPLDLRLRAAGNLAPGSWIAVDLSDRAKRRITRFDEPVIGVRVVRQGPLFVSLALVDSQEMSMQRRLSTRMRAECHGKDH